MRASAYFRVRMWRFRDVSMTDRGFTDGLHKNSPNSVVYSPLIVFNRPLSIH